MRTTLLYIVFCLALIPAGRSQSAAPRPNIVVIVADDLGSADVGFQGCKDIPTPNMDALAMGGVRCTSGYVSHPFCSPTRAGLLTGRYQQRFGHENNPTYLPQNDQVGLPTTETTIADVLGRAGYVTGAIGKWHLGAAPCFHPCQRGFGEYFGLIGGGHDYFQHNLFKQANPRANAEYFIPLQRQRQPVEETEYLTDALAREAAAFIQRHKSDPFFLYLAFNAPHTPLQAKPADLQRVRTIADEKRRTYAAMICAMDDAIGRVLDELRRDQIADHSLVVLLSDNGGPTSVTNSRNDPLRGAKGQVYEGGIRVPFVVHWPKVLPAGKTYESPVSSLDIFPTAAATGDALVNNPERLDGVNLLPHLKGEKLQPPHETLFWRTGGGESYAVRAATYKLVHPVDGDDELYDLTADVGETKNLAQDKPEVLALLQSKYRDWNEGLMRPLWQNPSVGKGKKK